jgi:hypothetical protein
MRICVRSDGSLRVWQYEGWNDIMYAGVDATGIDMQPLRDNSMAWTFFFEVFILVGSFFMMNLFIGMRAQSVLKCGCVCVCVGKAQ